MRALLRWGMLRWSLVGIFVGLVLALTNKNFDSSFHDPDARVDRDYFTAELSDRKLSDGHSRISDVRLYPTVDGVTPVEFTDSSPGLEGSIQTRRYFYSTSPDLIATLGQAGVPYTKPWWPAYSNAHGDAIRYLSMLLGGLLLIGIVWPLALRALIARGYGPKSAESTHHLVKNTLASDPGEIAPVAWEEPARSTAVDVPGAGELGENPSTAATAASHPLRPDPEITATTSVINPPKHFEGQWYPVARPKRPADGFTLAELLVVIGVIAMLIAVLLPAIIKARSVADRIACVSNLRSIGQGIAIYLTQNQGTYPAAYEYVGFSLVDDVQLPLIPNDGYVHWSTYLYGHGEAPPSAFTCPSLDRGGLPPANTPDWNLDAGQTVENPGIVDQQVPRLAYTLNEALCPRNKFVEGYQGATHWYRYVKATQVQGGSETILGTEWGQSAARIGAPSGTGVQIVSHRPVHGYVGVDGTLDMYKLPNATAFRRVGPADLDPDPDTATLTASTSRLDWVGRNHGARGGYPDRRLSNFLYADGHVESKTIYETLSPFQWGRSFYSLIPNNEQTP